jgi:hypothetical protein
VRPYPVLYTRSPTPAMILVDTHQAAPATCTPRDKQMRFSKRNNDKRKIKQNCPGFEFKPHQVNDSSQSNQGTDHLVSQNNFDSLEYHHVLCGRNESADKLARPSSSRVPMPPGVFLQELHKLSINRAPSKANKAIESISGTAPPNYDKAESSDLMTIHLD